MVAKFAPTHSLSHTGFDTRSSSAYGCFATVANDCRAEPCECAILQERSRP